MTEQWPIGDDNMPAAGDPDDDWEWNDERLLKCVCSCSRCGPMDAHDCGTAACHRVEAEQMMTERAKDMYGEALDRLGDM